jgi:hypothetical protein
MFFNLFVKMKSQDTEIDETLIHICHICKAPFSFLADFARLALKFAKIANLTPKRFSQKFQ